ncbi:MAG: hypothetical protein JSW53_02650 [Candidatus Bathyarchaeota archaeon]|nr:MAG: hypothetical protein JSW53_02650 [Candidatus Bathyarchaeota archaeon]
MVALVLSSMAGMTWVLQPFIGDLSNRNSVERHEQVAKHLLLNAGIPSDWGCRPGLPSSFGLASAHFFHPYELDIDKVSRLNNESAYRITYPQLLGTLGIHDVALGIEVQPLFDLSVDLASTLEGENETTYEFDFLTEKSGFPVSAQLQCYTVIKDYLSNTSLSTTSTGEGSANVTIPNSINGTALLVSFAEAKPQITTFNVHSFNHNSSTPQPNGTFMRLSPINFSMTASFSYPEEEILRAQVLTYNYCFNLTEISGDNQTAEYSIPRLLDSSPMILTLTGMNDTSCFAEWVSYPQLPLEIGADLNHSNVVSFTYLVSINHAFYECVVKCGGATFDYIQRQRTD